MKAEELLKDFLRDFRNWIASGEEAVPVSLITKRQELMIYLKKIERDAEAMNLLRQRNEDVTWIWRDDIGFLARARDNIEDEKAVYGDDPVEAILGEKK